MLEARQRSVNPTLRALLRIIYRINAGPHLYPRTAAFPGLFRCRKAGCHRYPAVLKWYTGRHV